MDDILHPIVAERIREKHQELQREGELLSKEELGQTYAVFREHFGPDRLRELRGRQLLEMMHERGNRESLMYWLEFKHDDEFPTVHFGSIGGGSAYKFGLFKKKDTGEWTSGTPKQTTTLSVDGAVQLAEQQRDQLLAGCEILDAFPSEAGLTDYEQLEASLTKAAPEVSDAVWGRKYFSLLYPTVLDDYHAPDLQRSVLFQLLLSPPGGSGRYVCSYYFMRCMKQLNLPMSQVTTTINRMCRPRRKYWRIGTQLDPKTSVFPEMQAKGVAAAGWAELGDLSNLEFSQAGKDELRRQMSEAFDWPKQTVTNQTNQLFSLIHRASEGDAIIASEGEKVLAVGVVTGGYEFVPGSPCPHRRPVDWIWTGEFKLPKKSEGLLTSFYEFKKDKYPENIIAIEQRLWGLVPSEKSIISPQTAAPVLSVLPPAMESIREVLDRKCQVILYGPPGTGKTYWADRTARELAARKNFGKAADQLSKDELFRYVRYCCFHPDYGYENFIEGYWPKESDGKISFALRDGIFKALCQDARNDPKKSFYLVVDEINRGDIPRIFGELLTLLEKDKREVQLTLPVSREAFSVPSNLYLIGTMNTADRSIALLDTALRRRFGFIELMPDTSLLKDTTVRGIPIGLWLKSLNGKIRKELGQDGRNLQIGHSYLMAGGRPVQKLSEFSKIVQRDIIPLLEEYCYEDYAMLCQLLGNEIVDEKALRVRSELFTGGDDDKLVNALLMIDPSISASEEAAEGDKAEQTLEESIDEEEDSPNEEEGEQPDTGSA